MTPIQNNLHDGGGMMGGYGLWSILGVLLAVFLIVAIVKLLKNK